MTPEPDPERLARDHFGYAVAVAREAGRRLAWQCGSDPRRGSELGEEQAGWALFQAVRGYDSARTPVFRKRVATIVWGRVRDAFEAAARRPRCVPIAGAALPLRWDPDPFADVPAAGAPSPAAELVASLPPGQAEAVRRVVLNGEAVPAVAADRGVWRGGVHSAVCRGLATLRNDPRARDLAEAFGVR